ncbi:GNAT family N-acetyltransferase [Devosia geojensis]|nr:GNAT family N-acetyltransferase [Devosia geojensis]
MLDVRVRPAHTSDIEAMSRAMTRSIAELCAADHADDPEIIAGWTRNKTPQAVAQMLANPQLSLFVAEIEGMVGAVGAIAGPDTVALNYVSPDHRRRGLSRALLAHMEAEMAARGTDLARLTSTRTALEFYRAHGWQDAGPPELGHNVPGYPMTKRLAR